MPVRATHLWRRDSIVRRLCFAALALTFNAASWAATFGTVVPIRGHVSDIAVDEGRGAVYAANFTANRIEVISMGNLSLQSPIQLQPFPLDFTCLAFPTLALSPDGRYLVVGQYVLTTPPPTSCTPPPAPLPLAIIDLVAQTTQTVNLNGASVLSVAFGSSPQALVVTTSNVQLLDPASGALQQLAPTGCDSKPLPVPWATFPPEIVRATAGVSGDGQVIYVFWVSNSSPQDSGVLRYEVPTGSLAPTSGCVPTSTSSPTLGPRVISVDRTGSTYLAGWVLFNYNRYIFQQSSVDLAQFPYPSGTLNIGSHAFDWSRNLIYAQIPTGAAGEAPVLHIVDSDNLTVRERLQLPENLAGKSVLTSDHKTMYSVSDSGVTMLPVGSLAQAHRVAARQEDILFRGSGCDHKVMTQSLDIVDPGGGATDFTLSLPAGASGITISQTSGTTPAHLRVQVDPTAFDAQKGTTAVTLTISSKAGVNIPTPVRLLVNTRDPDEKGTLVDVPGKIVDVMADPARNRFYVIRQDKNLVLAFDGTSYKQIGSMRTGNTPVQMAITKDSRYLIVGNDNSQIASVFDLDTMQPSQPIEFLAGYYPRSIAVSNAAILATARTAGPPPTIHLIDVACRTADVKAGTCIIGSPPGSLGIYANSIDPNAAVTVSPSGGIVLLTMPNGTVALYEASSDTFVASRKDLSSLGGAYAALTDDLFVVDNNAFNRALVPIGQLDASAGSSSGLATINGAGIRSTTPSGVLNGTVQRFVLKQLTSIRPVRTAESPSTVQSLQTPPVGQIGETILPFARTLAPLANGHSIAQLSTSGVMILPVGFDVVSGPPSIKAIMNSADQTPAVAPGGLISVTGTNLSSSSESTNDVPVPTQLDDVCLYANAEALPLFMVSSGQINAQLPFDVVGSASIVLSTSGGMTKPFSFSPQANAPAIFRTAGDGPMIIRTVDGKFITNSTPIHLNEKLIIYLTGMGTTTPSVGAGDGSPSAPPAIAAATPTITLGGASIFVLSAELVPNEVGVYQIEAQVPFHHIPTGSNIPFTITQGSYSTTVKVKVEE